MKHLFRKYFYSTLNPEEFHELTKYVREKKDEPAVQREIKWLWDNFLPDDADLPTPNSQVLHKIKEAIWTEERKAAQRKINIYFWGLNLAAVLIVGLIISTFFSHGPAVSVPSEEHRQTVTTPFGARTNITLPDGSIAWLNSGTTLSFFSKFDEIRRVSLTGEAYFEVEKNDHPFVVSTQYGEVKVKGTSFNVKAYNDDESFETTLVEGVVALKDENSADEVILRPGHQAVQTSLGFDVKEVDTRLFTSWKEGKLIFSKEPFPSFIKKLARWYNVKIKCNDPKLDRLWYTGTLEMETISEVMTMISKASPVEYHFNPKTRVFTIQSK